MSNILHTFFLVLRTFLKRTNQGKTTTTRSDKGSLNRCCLKFYVLVLNEIK